MCIHFGHGCMIFFHIILMSVYTYIKNDSNSSNNSNNNNNNLVITIVITLNIQTIIIIVMMIIAIISIHQSYCHFFTNSSTRHVIEIHFIIKCKFSEACLFYVAPEVLQEQMEVS